jgi:hypothetical protein
VTCCLPRFVASWNTGRRLLLHLDTYTLDIIFVSTLQRSFSRGREAEAFQNHASHSHTQGFFVGVRVTVGAHLHHGLERLRGTHMHSVFRTTKDTLLIAGVYGAAVGLCSM